MRVLEFYSGIGGMHVAFQKSTVNHEVAAAVEINDVATSVYKHNFPNTLVLNRVIESLSADFIRNLNANVWSLCPPCQPFTRLGKRMCEADSRTSSFLHILDLIAILKPEGIILENVKGFEHSEPWRQLIEVLNTSNYEYHFLLSPVQFGIPNCRLRFYLVARLRSLSWNTKLQMGDSNSIDLKPSIDLPRLPGCLCAFCCGLIRHIKCTDDNFAEYIQFCRPISEFLLSPNNNHNRILHFLDEKCLQRYFRILDIVRPCDKKTRCFTKGYAKRMEGTGSILQTSMEDETTEKITKYYEANKEDEHVMLQYAGQLRLRFFHHREVANMLCFPKDFEHVTEKQRLRLLGNSVNVLVVSHLIYWAFGVTQ